MTTTAPPHVHVTHGMDMGKMIGPLPMGAWVAIVGGGLAFALYARKANTSTAAATTPPVDTSGGVGVGGSGQWTNLSTPTTSTTTSDKPTNNDQWQIAAIDWLIGKGYDPGLADSAIRKYMGGAKLSVSEYALVREALTHLGEPPTPLPAPLYNNPIIPTVPAGNGVHAPGPPPPSSVPKPHTPTPTPKPAPKPVSKPAVRHYTTVRGDTLWAIAFHFYHNPLEWTRILNANPGKIPGNNPRNLGVGVTLVIP